MIYKLVIAFWLGAVTSGSLTFYKCKAEGRAYFAGTHIKCQVEKQQ